jgi:hypothetical protein
MVAALAASGRVVRGRRLGCAPERQRDRGRVHVVPGHVGLGVLAPGRAGQGRDAGLAAAAVTVTVTAGPVTPVAPVTAVTAVTAVTPAALGPPGVGRVEVRAVVLGPHPGR